MNRSNLWCPRADHTINVSSSGYIGSCCVMEPVQDQQGEIYNVKNHTISEAYNSEEFQQIRENLNNGIQDPHCVNCWKLENLGNRSVRTDEVENEGDFYDDVEGLVSVSLDLSNLCNLKCRTCNHNDSTMWMQETRDIYHKTITIQDFSRHSIKNILKYPKFEKDLFETILPNIREINFKGGEPFLMKEQWRVIDHLLAIGKTDTAISYHTNATIWDQEKADKLSKFSIVGLSLSIDDIGDRFNYLRHPGDWSQVRENILSIRDWCRQKPDNRFTIFNTVVSSFNVLTISDILDFGESNDITIRLHPTLSPEYFSIIHLPRKIKDVAIKNLKQKTWFDRYQQEVDLVINMLKISQDDADHWKEFLEYTQRHDEYRKEDFRKTFPELWHHINNNH